MELIKLCDSSVDQSDLDDDEEEYAPDMLEQQSDSVVNDNNGEEVLGEWSQNPC